MRIEVSPSGRATCRGCKQTIAKGELRFAESYSLPTGEQGQRYYHLRCGAENARAGFQVALGQYDGEIPDRAALEAILAAPPAKGKGGKGTLPLPHADRAPTGRARCIQCEEAIGKGELRVAVEREIDTGTFSTRGAGYLHPGCAMGWWEAQEPDGSSPSEFVDKLLAHSALSDADKAELRTAVEG
jgi:hypothetical protein